MNQQTYRLVVICGIIIAQRFDGKRWYTLTKSRNPSFEGLAVWKDTRANRSRLNLIFCGAAYQVVEAPSSFGIQQDEEIGGWRAYDGEQSLYSVFGSDKAAAHALVVQKMNEEAVAR